MSETPDADVVQAQLRQWLADALPGMPDVAAQFLTGSEDVVSADGHSFTTDQIAAVLSAQIEVGVDIPRFAMRGPSQGVLLPVLAWRMTVHRQVRAVLTLRAAGLSVEMLANARVALEHGVLLRGIGDAHLAGGSQELIDAVVSAMQQNSRTTLKSLARLNAATGSQFDGMLAAVEASPLNDPPPKPSDRAWNGRVDQLFRRIEGGEKFYSIYRALSDTAHAGVGSAQPYLQRLLTEGQVSRHPIPPPSAEILMALVWAVWSADDVLQLFLVEGDLRQAQTDALAPFGLAPPSKSTPQGPFRVTDAPA